MPPRRGLGRGLDALIAPDASADVTIDGTPVSVPKGTLVIEAARGAGMTRTHDLAGLDLEVRHGVGAAPVGQDEVASRALEQLFAELIFEDANLSADCRLGEAQLLTGAGHPAFTGDVPEIEQMLIIQAIYILYI